MPLTGNGEASSNVSASILMSTQGRVRRTRILAVRRMSLALAVLGVVGALGVLWSVDHKVATCTTKVDFRGVSYTAAQTSEEIISADTLGTGSEHGCGWKGSYRDPIAMNSIPGVDPHLALASPVSAYTVYLATGVTPSDLPDKVGTVILDLQS